MAVDINIHYTDPTSDARKQPFTIVPGETNTSVTSLTLLGQGTPNYSSVISQNFLHMLENFASATPPSNATVGQLWYNSTAKELRMLTAISGGTTSARQDTWTPVGANISIGTSAPTDLSRLWYDTSDALTSNHQLKIYNTVASAWQPVSKQWLVVSATAPTNTSILWYNTSSSTADNHQLYVYDTTSSAWQTVVSHNASFLTGSVPDAVLTTSNIGGNAATATQATSATQATKLATARTISITGAATASATFDGTANVTLNLATVNAAVLTGTVPVANLGSSGTRTAGYYLAGNNIWTALPAVPDSYTKTETNTLLAARALQDSITYVGLAGNDPTLPYMRRTSDNSIVYMQTRLGYTPAPVSTTLAGYGITDAYTKAQVNALIPTIPTFPGNIGTYNGWTQLPNGLIMQWGNWAMSPTANVEGPAVQTIPLNTAFPNVTLNVQMTNYENASTEAAAICRVLTTTNTSFSIFQSSGNRYTTWFWFALGF